MKDTPNWTRTDGRWSDGTPGVMQCGLGLTTMGLEAVDERQGPVDLAIDGELAKLDEQE